MSNCMILGFPVTKESAITLIPSGLNTDIDKAISSIDVDTSSDDIYVSNDMIKFAFDYFDDLGLSVLKGDKGFLAIGLVIYYNCNNVVFPDKLVSTTVEAMKKMDFLIAEKKIKLNNVITYYSGFEDVIPKLISGQEA